MALLIQGQVGPTTNSDGAPQLLRLGRAGDVVISELHGRFYEQVYRGNVFSVGMNAVALSANTITLTATSTPILGVWNPPTSSANLVILQAALTYYPNTLTTPAAPGPLAWAASVGNLAVTTGLSPFNRKTMQSAGSQAKGFAGATALTGLTNNLTIFDAADFASPGILAYGTITASTTAATGTQGQNGVQNFDGSLIVPPGGVLSLVNTTSTTTFSVSGRLMWEEVAL